jgi:deazaflavin-dependent oxidoreductase (nitroreductase family)
MSEPVVDSPVGWVSRHIRKYVESGGAEGHEWRPGVPSLLLTTVGRRTGTRHRTALIYGRAGSDYVVVGSNGGSRQHPAWYLNLVANPSVDMQVADQFFTAAARTAEGDERSKLWAAMLRIWPAYEDYQRKTARQIPVVVLSPTPTANTP